MKRTLAVLAATALVASLATPMMAADTSSMPSGKTATTTSAPSAPASATEAPATATAPAQSKAKTTHRHALHHKRRHRTLHHAPSMEKGAGSTTESAAPSPSK